MKSAKYPNWPVFTLKIFSTNIYVIQTPEYIQAILGNKTSVSFYPFHIALTNRALGARQNVKDVVAYNGADNGYMKAIHEAIHSALQMGPSLAETKRRVLNSMVQYINDIGVSPQPQNLFDCTLLNKMQNFPPAVLL